MIKPRAKAWDLALPHVEFTYNLALSKATGLSPFKVVNGNDPIGPLNLTPQLLGQKPCSDAASRMDEIQKILELVRSRTEKSNTSYQAQGNKHKKKVAFQPRDLMWIHLRTEIFPSKRKKKLMPRVDGLFEVLKHVNDNACKVHALSRRRSLLAVLEARVLGVQFIHELDQEDEDFKHHLHE